MSRQNALSVDELNSIFSNQRISRLQEIYDLSIPNSILMHEQLSALTGTIHASASILEIHLRNVVLHALKDMFGPQWANSSVFASDNFLRSAISRAIKSAKKNNYSKMVHADRSALKKTLPGNPQERKKAAIASVEISEGDMIAHLYFSFWRHLYSKTFEPQLWFFGLRRTFPHKHVNRGKISDCLEVCYRVRNRVAHNEFVHPKLCNEYLDAITFLAENMGYPDKIPSGRIMRFQEPYITRIKYQLSELRHFLDICYAK